MFRKSFVIANALLAILIIGLVNLPSIIGLFQSDDPVDEHVVNVIIVNETDDPDTNIAEALDAYYNIDGVDQTFTLAQEAYDEDEFWDDEETDVLLIFKGNLEVPDITIYNTVSHLEGFFISQTQQYLNTLQGIEHAHFDFAERPVTDPDDEEDELDRMFIDQIASLLVLPMFILILLGTQFLGVDIIEEKSTKAIETIIASVPARTHFLSKISSNMVFIIAQGGLLISFALIGTLANRLFPSEGNGGALSLLGEIAERVPNWPSILIMTFLFIVVGAFFYLVMASLLAAISTTQEDFQQFNTPMVLLILASYYLAAFLPMSGADRALQVIAFIPLFAPLVGPIAYATGSMTLLMSIISFAVLALFTFFAMRIIAPAYKIAILSYEETKFFKRIGRVFKNAFSKKAPIAKD